MDVDDPESGPASPEQESFDQAWSPTNSGHGSNSEDDISSGPGTPRGDPMDAEEGNRSGGNDSHPGSDAGSESGAKNPTENTIAQNGESLKGEAAPDGQPRSPDEATVTSPVSQSGPEENEDNDFDNLDLEETEEEKDQRIKGQCEAADQQKVEAESSEISEEQQHDVATDSKNTNNVGSKRDLMSGDEISDNDIKEDVLNTSKSSLHDDHGELDYDEDIHDETAEPEERKDDEKSEEDGDIRKVERREDKKAAESTGHGSDEDDGELEDDDDCEEGEIKEPGGNKKPFVRPICRFYNRGNCTWGSSCRFLHPGVNDKGNYSLIERSERPAPSGIFSRLGPPINGGQWGGGDVQSREDAPHPPSPPVESSWERGLRQAKELMKRANKRKETEINFEEKRLNLSLDEDKDFNKENDRGRFAKDPYYDNSYDDEDEYYGKSIYSSPPPTNHWHGGHYENFEVRWTREPEYQSHRRSPHMPERERLRERMPRERRYSPETDRIRATVHQPSAVFLPRRMTPETERLRYEKRHSEKNDRYDKYDNFDRQPNYNRPLPYMLEERPERMERSDRKRMGRNERGDHSDRFERPERPERQERLERPDRIDRMDRGEETQPSRKRGDEWHDPWIRAKKSPVRKRSTSRSRSHGRRRSFSRGSRGSSSSSYTSSSDSSRGSRSRSSSYSSYTSRSSSSSSSGSSRSRSRGPKRRPLPVPGPTNNKEQRHPVPTKPGEVPKSTVTIKPGARGGPPPRTGPPGPNEARPPGGGRGSNPGGSGGPPSARGGPPPRGPPAPRPVPPPQPPPGKAGPQRSPEKKPVGGAGKGGPPERGRPRERGLPSMPKRKYSGSSSGSSRSRSYSSSSSRSGSSRSSISSSSSSSSSGSADSEHLYRDIASGHSSDSSRSPTRREGLKNAPPGKKRTKTKGSQPPPIRQPPRPAEGPRRPVGLGEKNSVRPSPDKRAYRGQRPDGKQMPEERHMSERRPMADGMGRQVRERDQFVTEKDPFGRDVARNRENHGRERENSGRENINRDKRHEEMPRPKKPDDMGRRSNRGPEDMPPRSVRHDDDRGRPSQLQAVMKSVKQDPLKLSGQKSNIKLTLINKSADKSGQAKKRPANDATGGGAPPPKRPAPPKAPQPKEPKPAPKPVSASSARQDKPKPPPPKPKPDEKAPVAQKRPEPPGPKPPAPPAPKPKKSASSRREELLKQLKAVEDAIARKRAKLS